MVRPPAIRPALTGAFVALAAGLLAVSPYALLVMLPALLLAWVVAIGWFTGERAITLVRRALRRTGRRGRAVARASVARTRRTVSGGLLVASHLASRPPPARI